MPSIDIHIDTILILDYGSQYTQLIARRIRELQVYCEILPWDVDLQSVANSRLCLNGQLVCKGIILSGGPESVLDHNRPGLPEFVLAANVPILGICYGMQLLSAHFGGQVEAGDQGEFGHTMIQVTEADHLFAEILQTNTSPTEFNVWMSHGDQVTALGAQLKSLAVSHEGILAAMRHRSLPIWGVQFHPEVSHTYNGDRLLRQFLVTICGCQQLWQTEHIAQSLIESVKTQVGPEQVLLGLSGGVDSSVVAALLHKAIGDQLVCVFVDNGLLRLDEAEQVMATFKEYMGIRVVHVKAQELFFQRLEGLTDPEDKRKAIGETFIEVFEREADRLTAHESDDGSQQSIVQWLAQGTIYPDVIESAGGASGKAKVIKSHHNVGGLPETMALKLLEPLKELFKDEVRQLGVSLGLPAEMIYRHPFPGPGLGVRILGEIKAEYANILRQADAIFIAALREAELYDAVSQAFVVFLPVKSVGVVGDVRRYAYVVAIRAVETLDFMTAKAADLPYDFLQSVAHRIMNQISEIARVTYDISSKPPATIEWE